jgi:hypothetical protein
VKKHTKGKDPGIWAFCQWGHLSLNITIDYKYKGAWRGESCNSQWCESGKLTVQTLDILSRSPTTPSSQLPDNIPDTEKGIH